MISLSSLWRRSWLHTTRKIRQKDDIFIYYVHLYQDPQHIPHSQDLLLVLIQGYDQSCEERRRSTVSQCLDSCHQFWAEEVFSYFKATMHEL